MKRTGLLLLAALSGFGASQFYSSLILDPPYINQTPPAALQDVALHLVENYNKKPFTGIYQDGEQDQQRGDALVGLAYIQIRQQQEIIRLLTDLKAK